MMNFVLKTVTATAAAALIATSALANEGIVKEVSVTADVLDLEGANARMYYPDITQDLVQAIIARTQLTEDPNGYVIDVKLTEVSLDGDTVLPDSMEFNEMKGNVSISSLTPQEDGAAMTVNIRAASAEGAVPEGYVVVDPGVNDFYAAMIDGFASAVVDKLPETLPDGISR